ncbi:MAG: hypothetical protein R2910_03360 [Gemmatimonadales bacterium]
MRWLPLAAGGLLSMLAGPPLSAQSDMTLAEAARWLERDGTDMAVSSSDETATTNLRRVTYTASATLALDKCQLTIVVTDNSGVSGTRTTMRVPMKDVDTHGVRPVSRPEGYHDFIYIPGKFFVTIPARDPDTYPFLTMSSRGELRSYLATIPVKDAEASRSISAVVRRAAELCGAPANMESDLR